MSSLASTIGGMVAAVPTDTGKPLESIPLAAQRVNSAVVRIGSFIDRFHGEGAPAAVHPPEPAGPHMVNIERLFVAIDRLETRLEALENIG